MANSLLDFVMSVVRDPDVAAQYADNPAQAIANAGLTDVTSVDVNNLIPVVAESLSSAMPSAGADHAGANVWASGAATAAFDAFDSFDHHLPTQVIDDGQPVVHDFAPGSAPPMDFDLGGDVPVLAAHDEPVVHLDQPVLEDVPVLDSGQDQPWGHDVIDDHAHHQDDSGLDLFT
jgi:hypothetical protein